MGFWSSKEVTLAEISLKKAQIESYTQIYLARLELETAKTDLRRTELLIRERQALWSAQIAAGSLFIAFGVGIRTGIKAKLIFCDFASATSVVEQVEIAKRAGYETVTELNELVKNKKINRILCKRCALIIAVPMLLSLWAAFPDAATFNCNTPTDSRMRPATKGKKSKNNQK